MNASNAANTVTLHITDSVAVLGFHRPQAHNSLDQQARAELTDAFAQVATDPTVRAVVLHGTQAAFCTGQDLKEHVADLQAGNAMDKALTQYNPMIAQLLDIKVPVIAAIEGPVAGAGFSLALHCDFRIASPRATFKAAFPSIGLAGDCGMTALLPAFVGPARAREILLLDPKLAADDALRLGPITEISDQPVQRATELAQQLAQAPTQALKEMKTLLSRVANRVILEAAEAEAHAQARLAETADHKEAVAAFLEKRAPRFTGR